MTPKIFVFANGGSNQWYMCIAMAEDGTVLGQHICSHERYALHDLGVTPGSRPDRHARYAEHYPNGYEMEFVPMAEVLAHPGITEAYRLNQLQRVAAGEKE